jgi:hypothetical protein
LLWCTAHRLQRVVLAEAVEVLGQQRRAQAYL